MEKLCTYDRCTGCGGCAAVCPRACITMEPDDEGFLYPLVTEADCIHCGLCSRVCPVLSEQTPSGPPTAYAAIHLEEQTRLESTSGGVFSLLCRWVLEREGIIFGAAYRDDFSVEHRMVTTSGELAALRGAKYVQSQLGKTYQQVQTWLEKGKYVLFSGTPCQVGGLVSFLGRDYDRLILVDLICHGVPSPKVWSYYIRYRSDMDADGAKPLRVNLRSKETGWPGYSIRFDYPDGIHYSALNSQDPFLRGFVGNLYLRKSCYDCQFKGVVRQSDFTLGDYWGVWNQIPELHDHKGTSLVLLHTEKAGTIWRQIAGEMQYVETDSLTALIDNPSALVSSTLQGNRELFFLRYEDEDFQELVSELSPQSTTPKRRGFVCHVFQKFLRITRFGKKGIKPEKWFFKV